MKSRLSITLALYIAAILTYGQNVEYGNNQEAGKYLKVDDAKIYYETYGTGQPLILLHGGLFGDISEYSDLIPKLSSDYNIIAINLRGHGKSEIGDRPFTYDMLAKDVYEVLRNTTKDKESAIVIGFSAGAITGLKLALAYPGSVKKLVCISGPILSPNDYEQEMLKNIKSWTGDFLESEMPDFVMERKARMPQPERWNEFVEKLKNAWLQPQYIDKNEMNHFDTPSLIIYGDRDQYFSLENCINVYRHFRNAQLSIIPGSDHLVLFNRPDLIENNIMAFLRD